MNLAPVIEITNLTYRYPNGVQALEDISIAVYPEERVGLIGPNGAGKSTLLFHLNGILHNPKNGRCVKIGGLEVEKKNLNVIRRRVGLVFQNPDDQLFCPSVYEDAAFGPRCLGMSESEVDTRVRKSLESVGIDFHVARKSGFHLSIGQKKRAAIASVLAMSPEILVLDEPTSALDPRGRRELIALLKRLGGTQIIVTHDLGLVRELCRRVILLSEGRLAADGPMETILSDHSLLEKHGME